ncbi:MAG: hypothetical protein WKF74_16345 [Pyrinomonadaceae bacterium]
MCGVRCSINDRLHYFWRARLADRVRDDAARGAVNEGNDKRGLFFASTKVKSSSISSVPGLSGTGAAAFFLFSCA